MSILAYIAGTLIAPNFAGYLLSKGLTNRDEKRLIKDIEDTVTEFNRKFDNTEVDSNYFIEFLEQSKTVETIIQRVFYAYNTTKEDYQDISKKLAQEAVEFVNIKKDEFKHTPIKKPSDFEEYFSELFEILVNFRESLLDIKDKAIVSMVDESIGKSEGEIIRTIEELRADYLLGGNKHLSSNEQIKPRLEELNCEYKSTFIPLDNSLIKRKEFSLCREALDSEKSLIIHGKAGRGKSGCTEDVINYCEENEIPYLAIKLDKRVPSMTAEKWGEDLGLPASITHCIHSVSKNEKAVIILDQLDALRWTLAHSRDALLVCSQIINQVETLNNDRKNKISVVFVCRTHDLENDNNIRALFKKDDSKEDVIQWDRVQVNELDEELVEGIVGKRYEQLTSKLKEILRIPSNLYIWKQLDPGKVYAECSTASHLISEWWGQLSEKCFEFGLGEDNLTQIKDKMVTFLEKSSRIFIPLSILNENKSTLEFLSSNAFLIIQDRKVSFAHQSILDCFLADKMLHRYYDGEDIVDIIGAKDKQTPGKRYQVQMFMQNLFEIDSHDFITVGQKMFEAKQIRYFVKFVFFEVLNQIDNIDENIQNFIVNNCENESYGNHIINNVIFSKPNYIKLLRQCGILEKWFNTPSKKDIVINLLVSMSPNFEADDITFIEKYSFNSQEDDNKLSKCFLRDINQDTDELFELRMKFYKRYPRMADNYLDFKSMLKNSELRTIRLLAFLLENKFKSGGKQIYYYEETFLYEDSEILINNGEEVLNLLLPFVPIDKDVSFIYSDWSGKYIHKRGLERACIQIIKKANAAIISQQPKKFFDRYKEFTGKGNDLFNEIILDGLFRVSESYSDVVINYLCSDLNSNVFDNTSGNGDKLLLAKQILEKHTKYCSEDLFNLLEKRVLSYLSPQAKDVYRRRINYNREKNGRTVYWSFWGDFQKEILEILPYKRLSIQAKDLLRILRRKFPKGSTLYKYTDGHSGSISSPVAGKKLNNKKWIEILTNKKIIQKDSSRWIEVPEGFISSSIEEFASSFSKAVSEEPERMINLVLSNKEKVLESYVDSLFSGVASSKALGDVPIELLEKMILTYPYDYTSYRANDICSIIRDRKNVNWSQEILDILKDIAINHNNPELGTINVTNNEDKEMRSYAMLQSNAINCVRGNAAQAIAELLWNERTLFKQFKDTIERLVFDENPAVNLASLFALWPAYNIERKWASEIILIQYNKDYRLAGFYDTKNMLFLLYPKHREQVLKTIKKCYESEDKDLIEMGANCLSEMFIRNNEFSEIIDNVDAMSEVQAKAVLHMATNYFNKGKFNSIVKGLIRKFKASTLDLEIPISRLFYDDLIDLKRDKDFMIEIMNSSLNRRIVHAFVRYLEEKSKSIVDYKDIIFSMSHHLLGNEVGKFEEIWGIEDEISKLIIGLYDETSNSTIPEIKAIANECLNIWDLMFENQFGQIRSLSQKLMER
ncbi:hypothetical protein [Bacillus safensis]|uniref:hypothetical protein n=1 Tax=Bacillus safensis TaxID=561879 RepID=UPI000F895457|nr:hypothetical protein [Bacillus safensis]MBU5206418.1 hypothetical protein [Bacillus safensis]RUK51104.1 hypothetical protein ELP67_00950 [Bacillus safensis]